jgi:hypothetical protein
MINCSGNLAQSAAEINTFSQNSFNQTQEVDLRSAMASRFRQQSFYFRHQ